MKYLSLFSGIGGFEQGIIQAGGGDCVGYSEIDKYAVQIYEKHFNHKNFGDITKLDTATIPDFDLLVGGFPCQAFSIAGKRMGFSDTRGTLFFDIARILKHKKPKLLLLENVKGLLSHDNQRTFETILCTLSELGYDLQWQVLNSKNFGVPQNRERVFIIGHLRKDSRPEVFPIKESGERNLETQGKSQGKRKRIRSDDTQVAATLAQRDYKGGNNLVAMTEKRTEEAKRIRKESKNRDYSPRRGKQLEPRTDGMSNCVTAGQGKEHYLTNNTQIRRLTPTECERLQGFPDGWTEDLSDTQRYKTLGNAVTVNVIEAIITKLICKKKQ